MQDPNADTEWNDVLRAKGIIPPKEKEVSEDDVVQLLEQTIQNKTTEKSMDEMTLDELNEKEDDIDEEEERIFEAYRRQRMEEIRQNQLRARYGEVKEISKADYVTEVNKAGDGVWVVLHVYKSSIPLCKLVNQHLSALASKFPDVKFLKSISTVCIPNYPDKNLPTLFIYYEGDMKKQFVGPLAFGGMNFKQDGMDILEQHVYGEYVYNDSDNGVNYEMENNVNLQLFGCSKGNNIWSFISHARNMLPILRELEWMLSEVGAVKTELEKAPKPAVLDVMDKAIRQSAVDHDSSDENDW